MKIIKAFFETLALLLGADCSSRREAVNAGICDYSGQGRDRSGR